MFEQVKIILINPTHPGNIGSVARAMKNMGFRELFLVSPKSFPHEEASARAASAEDVLVHAKVVDTLDEALLDCHWALGLSGRSRSIPWPILTAREAAFETVNRFKEGTFFKVALVFGQEQSGLSNEELAKCHCQIVIPVDPIYPSLNLAQAVQIMVYELRMAWGGVPDTVHGAPEEELATIEEMEHFYAYLEELSIKTQFLDPSRPGNLMLYLRRLYSRSHLTRVELNILYGLLTALQKSV